MIHYLVTDSSGKITNAGSAGGFSLDMFIKLNPEAKVLQEALQDPDNYYWHNALVLKPARPSPHHDFDYTTKQWVANPTSAWLAAKQRRDQLLSSTDWLVTKALESGHPVAPAWCAYRQALRDITLQADPWAIVWPVVP